MHECIRSAIRGLASMLASVLYSKDIQLLNRSLSQIQRHIEFRDTRSEARLVLAVIAAEDHRYFLHMGAELRSILRAATSLRTKRYSGGSTVEQQLVRVIRGRYEFTIARKLSEIVLALSIYGSFSKVELVQIYLEVAYYGWHGSGLREILARLGLHFGELTQDQAILIASLLKRPLARSPSPEYREKLEQRIQYVRKRINLVRATGAAHALVERADL